MRGALIVVVFLLALIALPVRAEEHSDKRDLMCAGCTLVVHLIEQVIVDQEITNIDQFVEKHLCTLLPSSLSTTCEYVVAIFGPSIIKGLVNKENSDVICHALPFCYRSPQCHLNPTTTPKMLSPEYLTQTGAYQATPFWARSSAFADKVFTSIMKDVKTEIDFTKIDKARTALNAAASAAKNDAKAKAVYEKQSAELAKVIKAGHLPVLDMDGDRFSPTELLRGSNWRGRDCRDLDNYQYPGRKVNPYGHPDDYNCNGVFGIHPSGSPWKQVLCDGSQQRGVGVIGDSAGAHFSIPPAWVTPATIGVSTYSNLLDVLGDEFDWPQFSAYTGFGSNPSMTVYPFSSVYKEVVSRNKCNFRDYQNLAVNGGDSWNVQEYQISLARNQTLDHPMLMFLELLGNDVCGEAHNFLNATTPPDFKANIEKILNTLDTSLPAGSHVVILGLVDGRPLFDILHNKPHPIGGGVTYEHLYDFLNCVYCNPCWGWLNSNGTVRDETTARANVLNDQYKAILAQNGGKYKNFDVVYYDTPVQEIINTWTAAGRDVTLLVEPVDGFHPSQYFLSMLSDYIIKRLSTEHPEFLGPINPQNNLIESIFENQGGY